MRVAALALLLATPPASWSYVPVYQLLQQSKLVVAGEVVDIRDDAKSRPIARLKIARLYKGDPGAGEIELPFKLETTWACDFTISYTKGKKYLLLLDEKNDSRVVHYPSRTHEEIQDYEHGYAEFVRISVEVLNGVDAGVADLVRMAQENKWKAEALQVFRVVPRSAARPHLAAVRKLLPVSTWGRKVVPGSRDWDRYCMYSLPADLQIGRDLSLVSHLLAAERDDRVAPIEGTLSIVTGWTVTDLDGFKASWEKALRRAAAQGAPDRVPELVKSLSAADPGERDRAFHALLDLGPGVLEALGAHAQVEDIEARERVRTLIRELQLLEDLRSDLAARAR
jgi:hypothetical protein